MALTILVVMGAGVVTVFVKNDTPPVTTVAAPDLSPTVPATFEPTVAPTTTVDATNRLAARNGTRKAQDDVAKIPKLPASGVGGHPVGIVLIALGCGIAAWVRRAARA